MQTSDGQCLTIDDLSGDFRANLTPVQVAECDGSDGQSWDIITSGEHINEEGMMLVVSTLVSNIKVDKCVTNLLTSSQTQACLNFDPRRAAGDQVNLFSCGGRADGGKHGLFPCIHPIMANHVLHRRCTSGISALCLL